MRMFLVALSLMVAYSAFVAFACWNVDAPLPPEDRRTIALEQPELLAEIHLKHAVSRFCSTYVQKLPLSRPKILTTCWPIEVEMREF